MSLIKNYSQKILILFLCICIALMPMVIPAQAHAIALEGAALAAAFGLSETEFGALLTMLASGIEFTSAEAAAAAATAAAASTTAIVPAGTTALATVTAEAAAAGAAIGPIGWIAIGAVGLACLTPTIVSIVSLWKDDSVLNPAAANIVDQNNNSGIKFVPMLSDDYTDAAACVPLKNYFLDPYGDWDYNCTSFEDLLYYFAYNYEPLKVFEIEYAASNAANISGASISGYFTNPYAYRSLDSDGNFIPEADLDNPLQSFWFNLVYKWTDSKGTHIVAPATNFHSANVYGNDPLADSAWYYDPDIITHFNGMRAINANDPEDDYFVSDPLGFLGIGPYSLLYPYVDPDTGEVEFYLVNPGTTHLYDWASNPENQYMPYGYDQGMAYFEDDGKTGLNNRNTRKNPQPGYAEPLPGLDFTNVNPVGNTYVPVPSDIAEMDWDELMEWYKNYRQTPELEPVPISDISALPPGENYFNFNDPEVEDPIRQIIPDLPEIPDIDIPGLPEIDVDDPDSPSNPIINFDPLLDILRQIRDHVIDFKNKAVEFFNRDPVTPVVPEDPEIEDPDVDVTDAADPALDIFNEYNQFEGLFSHFLPPEVAAMLWTFTLVGIFIFIIRFLIDR